MDPHPITGPQLRNPPLRERAYPVSLPPAAVPPDYDAGCLFPPRSPHRQQNRLATLQRAPRVAVVVARNSVGQRGCREASAWRGVQRHSGAMVAPAAG